MGSATTGMAGVKSNYVIDNSIAVGVEWKGISSNQSLPSKEVRCEYVHNPGLCGQLETSKLYPSLRLRTWRAKDQYILPIYGFPSLSTAPVYIESEFLFDFACGGVVSANRRYMTACRLTESAKSQMDSIAFWVNLSTDADPSSFLTTNNPCSDNPTSIILTFAEPLILWGLFVSFGVSATDFTTPFSIQTRRGPSEMDEERVKKSSEPFSTLEGRFRVVRSSPVSVERAVTWRVYEAKDFASPMAYIVESVTVRRSSITKDLKYD